MLDFNDAPAELPQDTGVTRESLRTDLVARLESVLATLFPAGKKRKGKFLIGDVLGSPGDSLEVVLEGEKAGLWTDRADNSGGDVYALIGNHFGIDVTHDFPRVLEETAGWPSLQGSLQAEQRMRDLLVETAARELEALADLVREKTDQRVEVSTEISRCISSTSTRVSGRSRSASVST